MNTKDYMFGALEAVVWYLVVYLWFFTIKNDVNLFLY